MALRDRSRSPDHAPKLGGDWQTVRVYGGWLNIPRNSAVLAATVLTLSTALVATVVDKFRKEFLVYNYCGSKKGTLVMGNRSMII